MELLELISLLGVTLRIIVDIVLKLRKIIKSRKRGAIMIKTTKIFLTKIQVKGENTSLFI